MAEQEASGLHVLLHTLQVGKGSVGAEPGGLGLCLGWPAWELCTQSFWQSLARFANSNRTGVGSHLEADLSDAVEFKY